MWEVQVVEMVGWQRKEITSARDFTRLCEEQFWPSNSDRRSRGWGTSATRGWLLKVGSLGRYVTCMWAVAFQYHSYK